MSRIREDPRIDPRLKAIFVDLPPVSGPNVSSREEIVERFNSPEAVEARTRAQPMMASPELEVLAPSEGLTITDETFESQPDGNTVNVLLIRPESDDPLPTV